ncbi:LysE family translocator [Thorsellia kenyensis]|uniref:LysE family translocator n=1 Tax=Thorsellia kenyensis TaxID=1549888 RepID=A0ABV6CFR9_9GAMM
MDLTILFTYIISIILLIITPGPVMALVINVASKNKKKVISTLFGTNFASLVYISLAALTIAGMMTISDSVMTILSFLGSLFIFYLGIQITRGYFYAKIAISQNDALKSKTTGGFFSGFLVAIANPKDIIFFISFFPQFILITDSFSKSITILSFTWIILDFLVLYACAIFMQKQTLKVKQLIELGSGILLLGVSIISFYFNYHNMWVLLSGSFS